MSASGSTSNAVVIPPGLSVRRPNDRLEAPSSAPAHDLGSAVSSTWPTSSAAKGSAVTCRRHQRGPAFAVLFDRHALQVYNYCFHRTADWAAAEDPPSATFSEAWRCE